MPAQFLKKMGRKSPSPWRQTSKHLNMVSDSVNIRTTYLLFIYKSLSTRGTFPPSSKQAS